MKKLQISAPQPPGSRPSVSALEVVARRYEGECPHQDAVDVVGQQQDAHGMNDAEHHQQPDDDSRDVEDRLTGIVQAHLVGDARPEPDGPGTCLSMSLRKHRYPRFGMMSKWLRDALH